MVLNFGLAVAPSPWDKGVTFQIYISWPARFSFHCTYAHFFSTWGQSYKTFLQTWFTNFSNKLACSSLASSSSLV